MAAEHRAAEGGGERTADHDGRPGLRDYKYVWRRHPDAHHGPHRENGIALHRVSFDRPLLTLAGGDHHRAKPSLRRIRSRLEQATGYPGYDLIIGVDNATIGTILKQNGYATSWFGKDHNTPDYQYSIAGPYDQWPSGMGFDYFYGFLGGETDQWTPFLFRNARQIFPWRDQPNYNMITGMADDAIQYLKRSTRQRLTSRSSSTTFQAGPTRRISQRRSGLISSKASSTCDRLPVQLSNQSRAAFVGRWVGTNCASKSLPTTRSGSG